MLTDALQIFKKGKRRDVPGGNRFTYGDAEDVGLKLEEQVVASESAIDTQRLQRQVRVAAHDLDNVSRLEADRFERGARQMSPTRELGQSADHTVDRKGNNQSQHSSRRNMGIKKEALPTYPRASMRQSVPSRKGRKRNKKSVKKTEFRH